MARDEGFDAVGGGGLADGGGDVEGVKIAGVDEAIDGAEIDVVGIDVIGLVPAELAARRSAAARTLAGSEPTMLCSRFDLFQTGMTVAPRSAAMMAGLQLRLGLVREAVADAEGEFFQGKHDGDPPKL